MSYRNTTDFIDCCHIEQDDKMKALNPKKGMWINLRSEYSDVWHQIEDVYTPTDYYGSVYFWKNDRGQIKRVSTYLYNVRTIVNELPVDARCIYSETINQTQR